MNRQRSRTEKVWEVETGRFQTEIEKGKEGREGDQKKRLNECEVEQR